MTNLNGRFGIHGGQYIPETLMNAVIELEEAYNHYKNDPEFNRELTELFNEYAGRPSRLYYAEKMTKDLGGAKIYLKREDLNHTGAHKINNVLGQALLAQKMGKTRLIAETGAGQHGVATATAAALMGMECVVFMGEEDTKRQALNVYRMRLLGAEVIPVDIGVARPVTGEKIRQAVVNAPEYEAGKPEIQDCGDFDHAFYAAAAAAKPGDTVLMSPASAAFDQFKNFMVRGDHFKKLVMEL